MSASSTIEWTDATWNPTRGCSRVSEGCRNCYAERTAARFAGKGQPYEGLAVQRKGSKWTGEVRLVPGKLADPLRWRKPRRVFVNSMSDLFHEKLGDEDIAAVFGVMAASLRHTFQVLTKRPERMLSFFRQRDPVGAFLGAARRAGVDLARVPEDSLHYPPLPNVWLGVSVEDQASADERIPLLLETPAAVRFVSYEPALGPVDLAPWLTSREACDYIPFTEDAKRVHGEAGQRVLVRQGIDWVIAGSESGPGARPAELDWFRRVRDDCAAAGVAFFFKQWVGAAALEGGDGGVGVASPLTVRTSKVSLPVLDGRQHMEWPR